jgi:predicted dehydrogenase
MYRHHPQTLKVKEIADSGALGQLRLIRGAFTYTLIRTDNYRNDPKMGGGCIWDVGCYPISYARMIVAAEPKEVVGWQVTGLRGIDEAFYGQMRFPGDIYAQFDCSFISPFRTYIEIVGSDTTLRVPVPFTPGKNEKLYLTRDGNTDTIHVRGQELYIGEVEDIADAVMLGSPPRVSLADSRANIATVVALLESARRNENISLD